MRSLEEAARLLNLRQINMSAPFPPPPSRRDRPGAAVARSGGREEAPMQNKPAASSGVAFVLSTYGEGSSTSDATPDSRGAAIAASSLGGEAVSSSASATKTEAPVSTPAAAAMAEAQERHRRIARTVAYNNRAVLLIAGGRCGEACRLLRACLLLLPREPRPAFNLALALWRMGLPREACAHWLEARGWWKSGQDSGVGGGSGGDAGVQEFTRLLESARRRKVCLLTGTVDGGRYRLGAWESLSWLCCVNDFTERFSPAHFFLPSHFVRHGDDEQGFSGVGCGEQARGRVVSRQRGGGDVTRRGRHRRPPFRAADSGTPTPLTQVHKLYVLLQSMEMVTYSGSKKLLIQTPLPRADWFISPSSSSSVCKRLAFHCFRQETQSVTMADITHTHTHTHRACPLCRVQPEVFVISIIDPPLGGSIRGVYNDSDDRAGLRGYVQFNKYTHTRTHLLEWEETEGVLSKSVGSGSEAPANRPLVLPHSTVPRERIAGFSIGEGVAQVATSTIQHCGTNSVGTSNHACIPHGLFLAYPLQGHGHQIVLVRTS